MEPPLPHLIGEKQVTGPTIFKGRDLTKAPITGGRDYEGHFKSVYYTLPKTTVRKFKKTSHQLGENICKSHLGGWQTMACSLFL